ncbi:MAG: hypothetical protein ACLQOO_01400 [Terriglobia bacterium]
MPSTNLFQLLKCAFTLHPSPFTLYPSLLAVLFLVAPSGAAPQAFDPPPVQSHEVHGDESRDVPKTFVDMTPAVLAKAVPELKHLQPAENQDMLPQILERVGAGVAAFFDGFPNTTCTEHVTSMVDGPSHVDSLLRNNRYNYLALAQPGAAKGRLQEFRADARGKPVQPDAESEIVIVTSGFVAMSVHFHPDYQADSSFRYLGRESMEKQDSYVVAFAQRPAVARQVAHAEAGGRSGIVFMQGVAWIDPVSFRILRLHTDTQQPEVNTGLRKETTQVVYSEVSFRQGGKTLWLPLEVTVTGQLGRYSFYNQHRYSDYRLFNVEVEQKHDNP